MGRPVWLIFVYTIIGAVFFPFVISTLLWMNNSAQMRKGLRNGVAVNVVLAAALLLYVYLAYDGLVELLEARE